jgi:hypothetical protein
MNANEVTTKDELIAVQKLNFDEYLEAEYIRQTDGIDGRLCLYPEIEWPYGATTIFYIKGKAGDAIGTVSVTADSPAGLHTDKTFPDKTEEYRTHCANVGQKLGSMWRIVSRGGNHPCIVGRLIDAALLEMRRSEIDVALCTFHPDHASWYKRMGFKLECTAGQDSDVLAPAVLMSLTVADTKVWERLRRFFFCD